MSAAAPSPSPAKDGAAAKEEPPWWPGVWLPAAPGFRLELHGARLAEESPLVLYLGAGGAGGRAAEAGLRGSGLRVMLLKAPPRPSPAQLWAAARAAALYVFGLAGGAPSRGVYLVGHGIGALLVARLLADARLLREGPEPRPLRAACLLAGVYDLTDGPPPEPAARPEGSGEAGVQVAAGSPPSPAEELLSAHLSFENRSNLSFLCDVADPFRSGEELTSFRDEVGRCRRPSGVREVSEPPSAPPESASPEECAASSRYFEKPDFSKEMSEDEAVEFSPVFGSFSHLSASGVRIFVVAAEGDGPRLTAQSRRMFARLAGWCDLDDMHFEIKQKVDRAGIESLLAREDNFLRRLIRFDIAKYH